MKLDKDQIYFLLIYSLIKPMLTPKFHLYTHAVGHA